MVGPLPLCTIKRGAAVAEVTFQNNIIGNFMVYKDRLETNLCSYLGTRKIQNEFV